MSQFFFSKNPLVEKSWRLTRFSKIILSLMIVSLCVLALSIQNYVWKEREYREEMRAKAEAYLKAAHEAKSERDVSIEIKHVLRFLELGDLELKDVDLDEEKIRLILEEGFRSGARKNLKVARERATERDVSYEIGKFLKYCKKTNLKPEDFDTSPKKLELLLKEGYKSEARVWWLYILEGAEKGVDMEFLASMVKTIFVYLSKAGCLPENIDMSMGKMEEIFGEDFYILGEMGIFHS